VGESLRLSALGSAGVVTSGPRFPQFNPTEVSVVSSVLTHELSGASSRSARRALRGFANPCVPSSPIGGLFFADRWLLRTVTEVISRPSVPVVVLVLSVLAWVLGVEFVPVAVAVVVLCATPASAVVASGSRWAVIAAALSPLVPGAPLTAMLFAAAAAGATLAPHARLVAPILASTSLALAVYPDQPAALVASAAAATLATLFWYQVAKPSPNVLGAAMALSAVLVSSFPALAAFGAGALPGVVAVTASAAALISAVVAWRTSTTAPVVVAAGASLVLLGVAAAFASPPATSSPGLEAAPLDQCASLRSEVIASVECYSQVLIDEYQANGLPSAISLVKTSFDLPPPVGPHFANNCHEALHFLGKAAALDIDGDIREVIRQGTDMCAAGFGHGIWEIQYALMTDDELIESVPVICRGWDGYERSEEGSFGIGCRHILGHTLASRYRGNIEEVAPLCLVRDPEADADSELVEDEIVARNNCLAGLFMENFLDLTRFRKQDLDLTKPFATCEHPVVAADEVLSWGCYNEIGALVVPSTGYDMAASLTACRDQADRVGLVGWIKESCYDSMARAIAPALEYTKDDMANACRPLVDQELLTYCAKGVAAAYAFNANDMVGALDICELLLKDPDQLQICSVRIEEIRKSLDSSRPAGDTPTQS
jgi:hypothetical protein